MADKVTTNSQVQTSDPKLKEFEDKIQLLKEKQKLMSAYVTAYSYNGKFDMAPVIKKLKSASNVLFSKAQEIRNKEEGHANEFYGTYIKVVRDPEPILTALSPREFTISDIVFYQYTEGYNSEDKQKQKNEAGKTPTKIYKTVKRTFENDDKYKEIETTWKGFCKTYKTWVTYIDKYEDIQKEINSVEEKKAKYKKKKEEEEYNAKVKAENKAKKEKEKQQAASQKAEDKLNNEKRVVAVHNKLKEYTGGANGPSTFVKYKDADQYLEDLFYPMMFTIKYHEEYVALGIDKKGLVYKEEAKDFELLKESGQKIIDLADKILSEFKEAYTKDQKCPDPDYSEINGKFKTFKNSALALITECADMKQKVEKAIGERQKSEEVAKKARQNETVSDEAEKKSEQKTLEDNIPTETLAKLEEVDTNGQGTLEGSTGSTEAPTPEGTVDNTAATGAVTKAVTEQEKEAAKKEAQPEPEKYEDENKWTPTNEAAIKSKKSTTSDTSEEQTMDVDMALANVAGNLVGAVLTDPSLMQTMNGMASTGEFNAESLQGMGNAMLASSINTLTNAMMNATGAGAVEDIMNNAFQATNTILVTATNIVPMIKELTMATVTTVTDELTSHVVEKVESILDPMAITTKIQEYTSYYTKQYTMSADDLKKKLLSPGDQAIENAQEEKSEKAKSDKMVNMTVKITDIKNKVQDGITMAKDGVKMVTTYINNGPDWVIKQLSTYTNFAIMQAEKYIDYGADYVIDQRDMWIAQTGETIGKRIAEKANKKLEQTTKKALDYIEVKKKYATQVAMASIMTAVQIVVAKLGPMLGMALKAGAKIGMKQLLKAIGG